MRLHDGFHSPSAQPSQLTTARFFLLLITSSDQAIIRARFDLPRIVMPFAVGLVMSLNLSWTRVSLDAVDERGAVRQTDDLVSSRPLVACHVPKPGYLSVCPCRCLPQVQSQ